MVRLIRYGPAESRLLQNRRNIDLLQLVILVPLRSFILAVFLLVHVVDFDRFPHDVFVIGRAVDPLEDVVVLLYVK